jgi:hypothetical protein
MTRSRHDRSTRCAIFAIVVTMLATSCDMSPDYREQSRLPSPSGAAVAIIYSNMGGGAAGWCYLNVAIVAKDTPLDFAKIEASEADVFNGGCSTDPKLQWLSEKELRLEYTIGEYGASTHQKKTGLDGRVRIILAPKP